MIYSGKAGKNISGSDAEFTNMDKEKIQFLFVAVDETESSFVDNLIGAILTPFLCAK
jgi:hypothetical protein